MKIPKFLNKKMVIFFILIIAFIYFLGSLNVLREGNIGNMPGNMPRPRAATAAAAAAAAAATAIPKPAPVPVPRAPAFSKYLTPGTLTGFGMDCCECLRNGDCSKQTNCETLIKERNITNDNRKCIYDESTKNSYFQPRPMKAMRDLNCTGCKISPTDPNCNASCPTDINYADYNCVSDTGSTLCTNMTNVPDIKQ
jgi:hypothetical protein